MSSYLLNLKFRLTKNNIGNIIIRVINSTDYADIIM